jgi:hypothetical protein
MASLLLDYRGNPAALRRKRVKMSGLVTGVPISRHAGVDEDGVENGEKERQDAKAGSKR